jgi:phosphatidylglycerophosphatase A
MKRNELPASVWKSPVHLLSIGLGSGAAPYAPGTFGTLAAVPLYYFLQAVPLAWYLFIVLLLFFIGIYLCGATARHLGVHDHSGIVWDEVVGYLITMTAAPQGWIWMLCGFGLFRLFDIVKPWPVRYADRHVSGGFGIMLDDVLAALYAWAGLYLIAWSGILTSL